MKVEQAGAHRSALGEGPHWDCRSSTLLYVDATTGEIMRFDPLAKGETDVIHLDGEIGNLIPYTEDNRKLMVCMNNGVYKLDLDTGAQTLLAEMFGPDPPVRSRINDGKCDAMGRLWAGNRHVFIDFKITPGYENLGLPDGMTTDVNDKIWMACFGSGSIIQVDPETAKILNTIKFPTKFTTSCCFGGKNYDVLYVTSASSLSDSPQPADGLLYQVTELGTRGKAAFEFAG
ncbi:putative sugar lactone lactonase YvrE isoform X2 [Ixodes scapularis]|uniref:putative sugar lactone lactonase YvrE isoform X2 n=1 Tax=Ixodes scapularis TaxID=6945 RepID=UPI001C383E73|nr:putative sugar lactone lactonase YvrE isoform X2 [Ixodes scapularis]